MADNLPAFPARILRMEMVDDRARLLVASVTSGKKFYVWADDAPEVDPETEYLIQTTRVAGKLLLKSLKPVQRASEEPKAKTPRSGDLEGLRLAAMLTSYAKDLLVAGLAKTPEEAAEVVCSIMEQMKAKWGQ